MANKHSLEGDKGNVDARITKEDSLKGHMDNR